MQKTTATNAGPINSAVGKPVIFVSEKQRGNPLLKYIRNVQWEFSKEIIPDYVMGTTCAIFVSIKYHSLHAKHADLRIRELGKNFRLRVLLVLVDVDDDISVKPLHDLNKLCFNSDVTLMVCWSNEECARYLEVFKLYENKSASSIQEKVENEFIPQMNKVLTNVRSVNKTDVIALLDTFGSFSGICSAKEQELILVPGLGDKKVKRLYQALQEPFRAVKQKVNRNDSSSSSATSSSSGNSGSSGDSGSNYSNISRSGTGTSSGGITLSGTNNIKNSRNNNNNSSSSSGSNGNSIDMVESVAVPSVESNNENSAVIVSSGDITSIGDNVT